jgi:hypothetical protein
MLPWRRVFLGRRVVLFDDHRAIVSATLDKLSTTSPPVQETKFGN